MKTIPNFLLCSGAVILSLTGCDLGNLSEVAAQLRQPQRYIGLSSEGKEFTVSFLHPVIPRANLSALGLAAVAPADSVVKVTYGLEVNGSGRREVKVTLRFAGDLLESVTLPAILHDLLGRPNIECILRMASGASMAGWTGDPVSATTIRTVLTAHDFAYDPLADLISVKLSPPATAARTLVVKIQRHPPDQDYKEITVSFRK